jgi:hypothetical protein
MRFRLTERLTIRISERLAHELNEAALRVDQDASAFVRELLRRELLMDRPAGGRIDEHAAK